MVRYQAAAARAASSGWLSPQYPACCGGGMSFIYEQESVRFTASPNQAYHARQQGIPGVRRHHVLCRAWTFDGPVDADRLCNAYLKVCRVHPMLRASFAPGGDTYMVQPCQPAV